MKKAIIAGSCLLLAVTASQAPAAEPTAGKTVVGVTVTEFQEVLKGWSAKKMFLGKDVYNDKNEKIGTVDDIIITPDKSLSYAIIGAGGFLGFGEHNVAIPVNQIKIKDRKFILPGATKKELERMPKFRYSNK